jgi:hypothetical protein
MTITNRKATDAYLHALNNMPGTRPNVLARMADRMAAACFDCMDYGGFNAPLPDAMMDIETSLFVGLCEQNDVNWRYLGNAA